MTPYATTRFPLAALLVLAACNGSSTPIVRDAGPGPVCGVDAQCADGIFCNGQERCAPTDPAADARGCIPAPLDPCLEGQTCLETDQRCRTECATAEDADGDGVRSIDCGGTDCDDADPNRFPGNAEVCDDEGHDEDCDGTTFGDRDNDEDGFIDAACCNGDTCGEDCDDANAGARPGSVEACDGLDNDCDARTDEGIDATFYLDADGDGFGDANAAGVTLRACRQPAGYSTNADDCDDGAANVNPAAFDRCDGAVDDDCSGTVDDPIGGCTCDAGDRRACPLPGLCGTGRQECVDGLWSACSVVAQPETCDGNDNDCDGEIDPDCACAPGSVVDCGSDEGECSPGVRVCGVGGAFGECIASVGPRPETCNGRDDDCDGTVDEGAVPQVWYVDADGDGVGRIETAIASCDPPSPTGYALLAGDCHDDDAKRLCEDSDPLALAVPDARALAAGPDDIVIVGGYSGGNVGYRVTPPVGPDAPWELVPIAAPSLTIPIESAAYQSVIRSGDELVAAGTGAAVWNADGSTFLREVTLGSDMRVEFANFGGDARLDPILWSPSAGVDVWRAEGAGTYLSTDVDMGSGVDLAIAAQANTPDANIWVAWFVAGEAHYARVDDGGNVTPEAPMFPVPGAPRACGRLATEQAMVLCSTSEGLFLIDFLFSSIRKVSDRVASRIVAAKAGTGEEGLLLAFEEPGSLELWRRTPTLGVVPFTRMILASVEPDDMAFFDVDGDGTPSEVVYLLNNELRVSAASEVP